MKPLTLKPRYALEDETVPDEWVATVTDAGRLLIPLALFGDALDVLNGAVTGQWPAVGVRALDAARRLIFPDYPIRLRSDYDLENLPDLAAMMLDDADPMGYIVVGREAGEDETVPDGYAELRTLDYGTRHFVIPEALGDLARLATTGTEILQFEGGDPITFEDKTYRRIRTPATAPAGYLIQTGAPAASAPVAMFAHPDDTPPDAYAEVVDSQGSRSFIAPEVMTEVIAGRKYTGPEPVTVADRFGAVFLGALGDTVAGLRHDPADDSGVIGYYAPDDAGEAPPGYTEVHDAGNHRVFLKNDAVKRTQLGEVFEGVGPGVISGHVLGTPGTPVADPSGQGVELVGMDEIAEALEALGVRTVNRSDRAMAARAAVEGAETMTVPVQLFLSLGLSLEAMMNKIRGVKGEIDKVKDVAGDAVTAASWEAVDAMLADVAAGAAAGAAGAGPATFTADEVRLIVEELDAVKGELSAARLALELAGEGVKPPAAEVWRDPAYIDLSATLKRVRAELADANAAKDAAYWERGREAAMVAWLLIRSGLGRAEVAEDADPQNPGWPLLYRYFPSMSDDPEAGGEAVQVGLHYEPGAAKLLSGLPRVEGNPWDDHSKDLGNARSEGFLHWLAYGRDAPAGVPDGGS